MGKRLGLGISGLRQEERVRGFKCESHGLGAQGWDRGYLPTFNVRLFDGPSGFW